MLNVLCIHEKGMKEKIKEDFQQRHETSNLLAFEFMNHVLSSESLFVTPKQVTKLMKQFPVFAKNHLHFHSSLRATKLIDFFNIIFMAFCLFRRLDSLFSLFVMYFVYFFEGGIHTRVSYSFPWHYNDWMHQKIVIMTTRSLLSLLLPEDYYACMSIHLFHIDLLHGTSFSSVDS